MNRPPQMTKPWLLAIRRTLDMVNRCDLDWVQANKDQLFTTPLYKRELGAITLSEFCKVALTISQQYK